MPPHRLLACAAVLFVATGAAFAGTKQVSTVTANNKNLHQSVKRATAAGLGQADDDEKFLNARKRKGMRQPDTSLNSGEPGPYGFPGPTYADDELGFYKNDYESYENSPLDGYYSWSGRVSP